MQGFDENKTVVRGEAYTQLFGEMSYVWHEKTDRMPHIDVHCYPPGHHGRRSYTLVTCGMSNLPMQVPGAIAQRFCRTELVFYCRDPRTEFAELLNYLAHYPFDHRTWFGHGHTIETQRAERLGSNMAGVLFLQPPVHPDSNVQDGLILRGSGVHLLWVVPITAAELKLAEDAGSEALVDVLRFHSQPVAFDPTRRSYV